MHKAIATPSRTKEILEQYNLHAKKGYGQNFLIETSVVSGCAEAAHCEGAVIEIGPGIGSLTEQLAMRAKHVLTYEVDEALLPVLNDVLSGYENVEIVLQDILEADIAGAVRRLRNEYGSVSVCANLPYYITTPVLFRLFECEEEIPWITVMVQKEMAERFAATPSCKEYSALSVECAYLYHVRKLFQVSRKCFMPAPNVDSTIVQFERRESVPAKDVYQPFFRFVRNCFGQRRKTLYNNLREMDTDTEKIQLVLQEAGIDGRRRPQELSVEEFERVFEIWRNE